MNADILDEIIALATPRRTVAEILDLSLGIILPWLRQAVGGAYLVHGDTVQLTAQRGLGERWIGPSQLPLAGIGRLSSLNRARVLRPVEMANWGLAQAAGEWAIQSLLLLPLDRQRLRGFLLIGLPNVLVLSRAKRQSFSTLGYAVGLAARGAHISAEVGDETHRTQAMIEMSRTLAMAHDTRTILKAIVCAAIQAMTNATSGAIYLFDDHAAGPMTGPTKAAAVTEENPEEARLINLGKRVALEVGQTGRTVCIADIAEDIRFADMAWPSCHGSLLVAPLQVRERPIGMIILESSRPDTLTQEDEQTAMSLATIAAEAIAARAPSERQDTLAGECNHVICRDLCRLLMGVAHELRNPLTAVMGYAQLLQATEATNAPVLRDLEKIQNQAQKAAKIVNNLSGFARHCGAEDKADLNDVLKQILALCDHALEAKNVDLNTVFSPQELVVKIRASSLQQALLRLVSYVREEGLVQGGRLHIVTETDGDQARVQFILEPQEGLPILASNRRENGYPEATPPALGFCNEIIQGCGGTVHYLTMGGGAKMWIAKLPLAHEYASEQASIRLGASGRAAGT